MDHLNIVYRNALRNTMIRAFYRMFAISGVFKLFNDVCQFMQPVMLNLVISFVQDREAPYYRGLLISLGIRSYGGELDGVGLGLLIKYLFGSFVLRIDHTNYGSEYLLFWYFPRWHAGSALHSSFSCSCLTIQCRLGQLLYRLCTENQCV